MDLIRWMMAVPMGVTFVFWLFKSNQPVERRSDPFQRLRFPFEIIGVLTYWFYVIGAPQMKAGTLFDNPVTRWSGGSLFVLGFTLWMLCHATLGRNWSGQIARQYDHQLITTGPYLLVRHPMYTSFLVMMVGVTLMTGNWYVFVPLWIYTILLVARVPIEEQLMLDTFGDTYRQYQARTKRFIPGVW